MSFLRLILAALLFLMLRRVYLSFTAGRRAARRNERVRTNFDSRAQGNRNNEDLGDLTQQDISDADFEEIP